MSVAACQRNLFEQSLLEGLRSQLHRTHRDLRFGAARFGAGEELLAIIRDEVAAAPITLEDRGDLVYHARVARARRSDVPLETTDLRGVGQVRGADVGRGEPRVAMKEPRLCVEP